MFSNYFLKLFVTCIFILLFTHAHAQVKQPVDYVNPFIGTGAVNGSLSGNNFPGATSPFGMVQLSPDTRSEPGWATASGYDYNDDKIYGFSHTHLSGTGVAELFDVLLMPFTGELYNGKQPVSTFSHNDEKATAGYYQVRLNDYNINAELTTTTRTGFHQYQYPQNTNNNLLIDLNHSADKGSWSFRITQAQIKVVDAYTIEGYRIVSSWAKLRKVYFYAKFSQPIVTSILTDGNHVKNATNVVNGTAVKAYLQFSNSTKPLLVKVALSPVSTTNAKQNLQTENPGWNFNTIKQAARKSWNDELQKINVTATETQKEIFYTALYHTFIQPNTLSDVNGQYMAADFTTRKLPANTVHYSTFSLWDTYRAVHPLYTLLQKKRTADFVNSLISQYDTYGYLPIWQLWGQDNYCMIGNHSIPVIVDAIQKNISGINIEKAYQAVKQSSLQSHLNSPFDVWKKYGYMPENIQTQSVSITLEMAYDDWCVAQLAKRLNKTEDYQYFMRRAGFYKNIFNPVTNFFQAKDDKGKWLEPFDPFQYGANGGNPFTEGNAWQYFWYVPHDVNNLISMVGGDNKFVQKLDSFFTIDKKSDHVNNNASGFIGQYAHGNEPSHHVAYLYNYAGAPAKTQFYVSRVLNELYNTTSAGYAGNEDCGQMSAWYVLSALGFYPVNPANGVYVFGSPLFASTTIQLQQQKKFTVTTKRQSDKDIYIQSVTLNGKSYLNNYILHSTIEKGGELIFTMGNTPSTTWGVNKASRPQ